MTIFQSVLIRQAFNLLRMDPVISNRKATLRPYAT